MKKASLLVSVAFVSALFPLSFASAHEGGAVESHSHETALFDHIGHELPKAEGFKDLESAPAVEQTTSVVELDEKGMQVDKQTTQQNVSAKGSRAQLQDTGSQKVTVLAVADEEYRSAYPDWQNRIISIIEAADDPFNRDHDIDYVVQAVGQWNSSGYNSSAILQDLQRDWDGRGYDFVAGFTRDANFDAGGIAYVYSSAPRGSAMSVNLDQGTQYTASAAQHEFTHNYGIGHDPQGSGIRCIMNYDYSYSVDYWDIAHDNVLEQNKYWYGS